MTTTETTIPATVCSECGMLVESPTAFHPFLHCELFKLGHSDPEAHLAMYGYTRAEEVTP